MVPAFLAIFFFRLYGARTEHAPGGMDLVQLFFADSAHKPLLVRKDLPAKGTAMRVEKVYSPEKAAFLLSFLVIVGFESFPVRSGSSSRRRESAVRSMKRGF